MGIKKCKNTLILLLVFFLTTPTIAEASTVKDVYEFYGVTYDESDYDEQLDIIQKYESAKKYVTMYQYIIYSEYDTSVINTRIESLTTRIQDIESSLKNGYNLPLDSIYALENEYATLVTQLEDAEKSLLTHDIDLDVPTVENTPSYSEYKKALEVTKLYSNIGDIADISIPVTSRYLVNDVTEKHATYTVEKGSDVTAVLSGRVVNINNNAVTINHGSGVYSYYGTLDTVTCSVGDYVQQHSVIGKSGTVITFKLKINDTLVDISKLFKEVE